jgi:hypothetical protein
MKQINVYKTNPSPEASEAKETLLVLICQQSTFKVQFLFELLQYSIDLSLVAA